MPRARDRTLTRASYAFTIGFCPWRICVPRRASVAPGPPGPDPYRRRRGISLAARSCSRKPSRPAPLWLGTADRMKLRVNRPMSGSHGSGDTARGVRQDRAFPTAREWAGPAADDRGVARIDRRGRRHDLADARAWMGFPTSATRSTWPRRVDRSRSPTPTTPIVAYAAARQQLVNPPNPIDGPCWILLYDAVWSGEFKPLTWPSAAPGIRDYLEAKRAALEIWREGSRASRCSSIIKPGNERRWVAVSAAPRYDRPGGAGGPGGLAPRGRRGPG